MTKPNGPVLYQTRPIDVQAWRWDGTKPTLYRIVAWVLDNGGTAWPQEDLDHAVVGPRLETPDGIVLVKKNDYIVLVSGVFRVYKTESFNETYEAKKQDGDTSTDTKETM